MEQNIDKYLKKTSTKLELITPKKAEQIISDTDFKNRDKKKRKIIEMAQQMKNEEWELTHQGISISEKGNLIDGQNRLHAIMESGVSVYMNVSRGFPEESFYQIDKGVKRSTADNFNVAGIKNYKNHAAGLKKFFMICDGEEEYPSGNRSNNRTDLDYIEYYFDNSDLCEDVRKISEKLYRSNRILSESESYSFMFYAIKNKAWHLSDVKSFMEQVYMMTSTECNAPSKLFERLVEDLHSPVKIKEKVKWAFMIKSFNAWVKRDDLKFLRYTSSNEGFPELIYNPQVKS